MAQDDTYRTVVCSEEGLQSLSQKLSDMSLTSVGGCLGLTERKIQSTEEDKNHTGTIKMYYLLVEWKNGQEQANWGKLEDRLQHLNDDSLVEYLREIASEGLSKDVCMYVLL